MTTDQQLEKLHSFERLAWIPNGLVVLTLGFLALGFLTDYDVFFVLGAFVGLAAVSSRETAPHSSNAIKAIEEGNRTKGTVTIAISEWDGSLEYRAKVIESCESTWTFEFRPQGWTPKEGCMEANIFHIRGIQWPVLLVTQDGILFPAFKPKRIEPHP